MGVKSRDPADQETGFQLLVQVLTDFQRKKGRRTMILGPHLVRYSTVRFPVGSKKRL